MITIPLRGLTPQACEELKTICLAIFVEVKDDRLMSVLSEGEVETYTELLRESHVSEKLYDIVTIFGEEHFVEFLKPVIEFLASTHYDTETYIKLIEKKLEEL